MAVPHFAEYPPQTDYMTTEQQPCSVLPRGQLHCDNSRHDNQRFVYPDNSNSCYDNFPKIYNSNSYHDNNCHDIYPDNSCRGDDFVYPDSGSYDDGRPVSGGVAGGRLLRSRSEETLSNVSMLPRRRLSTVRRRKKVTTAMTDRLISDFNDGKEVDLDNLAGGVSVAATGSYSKDREGVRKLEDSDLVWTQANVLDWLRTQSDASKQAGSVTKYRSLDVHHL